jgi:hypothetical protein
MCWAAFQACLEDRFPGNPAVDEEKTTEKCAEEMTNKSEATAATAPKPRARADARPPLSASIYDETRLKNRLRRQWEVTRDPALKDQVKRLQRSVIYRLNE